MIEIEATSTAWVHKLPLLQHVQHAIFISPNAVTYFFKHVSQYDWPTTIQTYAIGHGTKQTLQQLGITNIITPSQADSEHLLSLETLQHVHQANILLIKGQGGRTLIQQTLCQRGAQIIPIVVYQRNLPTFEPAYINSLWHHDAFDMILITNETALKHLFSLFNKQAIPWLCQKPCLVISERLAKAARKYGFKAAIHQMNPD